MMTRERAKQIIEAIDDDVLIDFATTCSNRGVAMLAETTLRRRKADECLRDAARMLSKHRGSKTEGDVLLGRIEEVLGWNK